MKRNSRIIGLDFMFQKYLGISLYKFNRLCLLYPNNCDLDLLLNFDDFSCYPLLNSSCFKELRFLRNKYFEYAINQN